MSNIWRELQMVVEHRITTLIAFASISLFGNLFILLRMYYDSPESKVVFFIVNVVPFELFIFIEGNLFLSKYVQMQMESSFFQVHFWAFLWFVWFFLFWVFLPPLSIIWLFLYNDIENTSANRKISFIGNWVLAILSIVFFLTTVGLTRFFSSDSWTDFGRWMYLIYAVWWIYVILFICFRRYIKYLNYIQLSTAFVLIIYISKNYGILSLNCSFMSPLSYFDTIKSSLYIMGAIDN